MQEKTRRPTGGGICPICQAATEPPYRPFCSRRCADIDLARWLKGTYAVPAGPADADEDGDGGQDSERVANTSRGRSNEDE